MTILLILIQVVIYIALFESITWIKTKINFRLEKVFPLIWIFSYLTVVALLRQALGQFGESRLLFYVPLFIFISYVYFIRYKIFHSTFTLLDRGVVDYLVSSKFGFKSLLILIIPFVAFVGFAYVLKTAAINKDISNTYRALIIVASFGVLWICVKRIPIKLSGQKVSKK